MLHLASLMLVSFCYYHNITILPNCQEEFYLFEIPPFDMLKQTPMIRGEFYVYGFKNRDDLFLQALSECDL